MSRSSGVLLHPPGTTHGSARSDVSRISTISVSAYLRTAQCVPGQGDMGNDLPMARVDLTPLLDGHVRFQSVDDPRLEHSSCS